MKGSSNIPGIILAIIIMVAVILVILFFAGVIKAKVVEGFDLIWNI